MTEVTQSYYEILGVPRTASTAVIKRAYRAHAQRLRPDICPSPTDKDEWLRVQEAYDTLRDDLKRRAYDAAPLTGKRPDNSPWDDLATERSQRTSHRPPQDQSDPTPPPPWNQPGPRRSDRVPPPNDDSPSPDSNDRGRPPTPSATPRRPMWWFVSAAGVMAMTLLVYIGTIAPSASATLPSAMAGSWEGIFRGAPNSWSGNTFMRLSLNRGSVGDRVASVSYPYSGCYGHMVLRRASADRIELEEVIDRRDADIDHCVSGSAYTAFLSSDNVLRVEFSDSIYTHRALLEPSD